MSDLPDDASEMAREIHRRMLALNLTPSILSRMSGVRYGYLKDVFTGRQRSVGTKYLPGIAAALGCDVNELLNPRRPESDIGPDSSLDKLTDGQSAEVADRRRALLAFWDILSDEAQRRIFELVIEEAERLPRRK